MKSSKLYGYFVLLLLLFIVPIFFSGNYIFHIMIVIGINIILTTSMTTICLGGPPSLGHSAFMAIGAYAAALLVMKLGFSFWLALPVAGAVAMLVAFLIGYPFIRAKGIYFAMLTLFFGTAVTLIIGSWTDVTGGSGGVMDIPAPNTIAMPGLFDISFTSARPYYYLILILVIITFLFLNRIRHSRIGLTLIAIRQGDFVAESVGINVAKYKVLIFGIGSFFAGIAGGFYAHYLRVLTPDTFGMMYSIYILIYMTVGGRDSLWGGIVGAIILTIVPEAFAMTKEFQPYVFVAALLLIIILLPEGIAGLPHRIKLLLAKKQIGRSDHA